MRGRRLLISELESTLLGDPSSLEEFARWHRTQGDELEVVYTTSRSLEDLADLVRSTPLPPPEAVISATGDQIRFFPDGRLLAGWPRAAGRWESEVVQRVVDQHGQLEATVASEGEAVRLRYRVEQLDEALLVEIRRRIVEAGCQAELICSSAHELNVQPSGVHRGAAAGQLAAVWNLQPHLIMAAGADDADLSLYLRGFLGIVVANAADGLKKLQSPDLYHATRGYAAGVLEGIEYWQGQPQPA